MSSFKSMATTAQSVTRNHDKYCWYCHETCSKHHCSTCFRSFHDICLYSSNQKHRITPENVLTCSICLSLQKSKKNFIEMQPVLYKLKHVKDEIMTQFNVLSQLPDWTESQYTSKIANPINLKDVYDKIDNNKYNSFEAFLTDIDCIFHNCKIHHGRHNEITKTVENMIHFCKLECQCISACIDCYQNYYIRLPEWRTTACEVPHLILWARLDRSCEFWAAKNGFTYWPAKFLAIDDDGDATIIFFGDSKFDSVRTLGCYLYSSTPPSSASRSTGNPEDMEPALKEVELYIKNVESKFQVRVDESMTNIPFNRRRIQAHKKAMFSDCKKDAARNDGKTEKYMSQAAAKRPRSNDEGTVIQNVDSSTDSDWSGESDGSSGRDTDDDISGNIVKLYGQYISKRNKKKRKINCLKGENDELRKQMDVAILKQTELKNDHSKEVTAIKAAHNKEMAEVNTCHAKIANDLKAQLQAKEAVITKMQEQNSKQENQLKIATNLLEKATRTVDELKKCKGCAKPLDGLCSACDAVWANLSSAETSNLDDLWTYHPHK